jgi:protein SCO1
VKQQRHRTGRRSVLRLAVAATGAAVLPACGRSGRGPSFKSTDITGADYGRQLALTGHDGRPRTLEDFRGKVVVLFFGFTQCPDVCPTTMLTMANVMKALGPQADGVQVLFVTLDPERDTPQVLGQYVPAFDPRFLGLYGDADATAKAAREFKVFFQKAEGRTGGSYSIDHTAASYVIDRQGRLRLYVRHSQSEADIAADLRQLLAA